MIIELAPTSGMQVVVEEAVVIQVVIMAKEQVDKVAEERQVLHQALLMVLMALEEEVMDRVVDQTQGLVEVA
tara:strand:+ start:370 stop:585 length:216 start_codon:yes stop_codon:yes gene_type:complete